MDLSVVDCVVSEDARGDGDPPYCYEWPWDCDGIDNDLEGTVDEGARDDDGNGLADYLDDWDGDGIPNSEDPDLECPKW